MITSYCFSRIVPLLSISWSPSRLRIHQGSISTILCQFHEGKYIYDLNVAQVQILLQYYLDVFILEVFHLGLTIGTGVASLGVVLGKTLVLRRLLGTLEDVGVGVEDFRGARDWGGRLWVRKCILVTYYHEIRRLLCPCLLLQPFLYNLWDK